jgi:hypothetical protein
VGVHGEYVGLKDLFLRKEIRQKTASLYIESISPAKAVLVYFIKRHIMERYEGETVQLIAMTLYSLNTERVVK